MASSVSERANLLAKNEQARSRVEAMIARLKSLEQNPRTYIPTTPAWEWLVANMQRAPVVSLALGPCAGLGAGRVAASHFSVMVKGLSQVFVAGPPVAKAIGENVDKEGLGGWEINGRNGVVDNVVNSEHEAFAHARRFLSYLPSHVGQHAPRVVLLDDENNIKY